MENIKQFIAGLESKLLGIKENNLDGGELIDAICSLIESVAVERLEQITLIKIQVLFKAIIKLSKSDFYSFFNAERKKKDDERKTKERCDVEKQLQGRKVSLTDIHILHRRISSSIADQIEVVLATIVSVRVAIIRKLPVIWAIITGAPSSDKTENATAASQVPQVHQIDTLTPAALASGFVDPKTGQKANKDYFLELNEGVLVIKDMSAIFSSQDSTVRKVLGELTNIYDGQFKKLTGTTGMVGGDSIFSMVCATTTQSLNKHHRYMGLLGPRFFTYRVDKCTHEQIEQGTELIWNGKRAALKPKYKEIFSAYAYKLLNAPEEVIKKIQISPERKKDIRVLSDFLCKLRSYSSSWREWDVAADKQLTYYDIQIEEPFRALQQLECLAICFALVHGRSEVTEHDIEMMRRLVLGSGPADRVDVLRLYRDSSVVDEHKRLSIPQCAKGIGRSYNWASALLHELVEIGVLKTRTCTPETSNLCETIHYFSPVPAFSDILTRPMNALDHTKEGIVS